jgi:hypothetical protein
MESAMEKYSLSDPFATSSFRDAVTAVLCDTKIMVLLSDILCFSNPERIRCMVPGTLKFELRPVTGGDFRFCWSLYRDVIKPLTTELLEWNELGQG